jgi:hypothetical protein
LDTRDSDEGAPFTYWFKQALSWQYDYNHEEAINCFKKARVCANAFADQTVCFGAILSGWFVAYNHIPNYNNSEGFDFVEANEYLVTAKKTLDNMKVSESANVNHSYVFVAKLVAAL